MPIAITFAAMTCFEIVHQYFIELTTEELEPFHCSFNLSTQYLPLTTLDSMNESYLLKFFCLQCHQITTHSQNVYKLNTSLKLVIQIIDVLCQRRQIVRLLSGERCTSSGANKGCALYSAIFALDTNV